MRTGEESRLHKKIEYLEQENEKLKRKVEFLTQRIVAGSSLCLTKEELKRAEEILNKAKTFLRIVEGKEERHTTTILEMDGKKINKVDWNKVQFLDIGIPWSEFDAEWLVQIERCNKTYLVACLLEGSYTFIQLHDTDEGWLNADTLYYGPWPERIKLL